MLLSVRSLLLRVCLVGVLAAVGIFGGEGSARAVVYISGHVIAADKHTPVTGASVSLVAVSPDGSVRQPSGQPPAPIDVTMTLANGSFILKVPNAGDYRLTAAPPRSAPGLLSNQAELHVPAAGLEAVEVVLETMAPIKLHLLTPAGKPATGTVALLIWYLPSSGAAGSFSPSGQLAADGSITFWWPLPQPVRALVRVRVPGAGVASFREQAFKGCDRTLTLQPGVSFRGAILAADGKPDPGAFVTINPVSADGYSFIREPSFSTRTDADGTFIIPDLFPGVYLVKASSNADPSRLPCLVDLTAGAKPAPFDGKGGSADLVEMQDGYAPPEMEALEQIDPEAAVRSIIPVHGKLVARASRRPVPNATVTLRRPNQNDPVDIARTHPDGSFTLRAPAAGTFMATVTDYATVEGPLPFKIAPGKDITLVQDREPPLRLRLHGPDGSGPIRYCDGLLYCLLDNGRVAIQQVGGNFSPPGNLTLEAPWGVSVPAIRRTLLQVQAPGAGVGQISTDGWPEGTVDVTLQPGFTVRGTVMGADHKPLPGANITASTLLRNGLFVQGAGWIQRVQSGKDGRFDLPPLLPGRYLVEASAPGTATQPAGFHAGAVVDSAGDDREVTLDVSAPLPRVEPLTGQNPAAPALVQLLDPGAASLALTGRVVEGLAADPVEGAYVVIRSSANGGTLDTAVTGKDGGFRLLAPAPDDYRVAVQLDGCYPLEQTTHVGPKGSAGLDLNVHRIPTVGLSVQSADGKPAAGRRLTFFCAANRSSWQFATTSATTDSKGQIALPLPGQTEAQVQAQTPIPLFIAAVDRALGIAELSLDYPAATSGTLRLSSAAVLRVRAIDERGRPEPGVRVTLTRSVNAAQESGPVGGPSTVPVVPYKAAEGATDQEGVAAFRVPPHTAWQLEWSPPAPSVGAGSPGSSPAQALRDQVLCSRPDTEVILSPVGRSVVPPDVLYYDLPRATVGPAPAAVHPDTTELPLHLTGRVRDQATGAPVAGALILLYSAASSAPVQATVTDARGLFTLNDSGPGPYQISVVVEGLVVHHETVKPGDGQPLDLAVPARPGLRVKVVSPAGTPLRSLKLWYQVQVESNTADESWEGDANIGPDGVAEIPVPFHDTLERVVQVQLFLRVEHEGWTVQTIRGWPTGPALARLQTGSAIEGSLVAQGFVNRPLTIRITRQKMQQNRGAYMQNMPNGNSLQDQESYTVTPGPDGHFKLDALRPGIYRVDAPGHSSRTILVPYPTPLVLSGDGRFGVW